MGQLILQIAALDFQSRNSGFDSIDFLGPRASQQRLQLLLHLGDFMLAVGDGVLAGFEFLLRNELLLAQLAVAL